LFGKQFRASYAEWMRDCLAVDALTDSIVASSVA
jgi:hypothetical protein